MNLKYDIEKINAVLWDFHRISKIKTVIFDSEFSLVTAAPLEESAFCNAMSQTKSPKALCNKCNIDALRRCREKRKEIIYRCHAGLVEAIAPIMADDIIMGYIMLGQVLESGCDKQSIIDYSTRLIGEKTKYLDLLEIKSDTEIRAAVRLMQSCVCYLLMNKLIFEQQDNPVLQLREYITSNPTADLSVDALCNRFSLSRNHLYKISNTYFGMPIASYIRNKRLVYAKMLIENGMNVTSACEKAGFYDYGYFGKLFKKHLGITPTKAKSKQ